MLKLLAVESSAEACSVALLTPEIEVMRISFEQRRHAQTLLPMVDELLEEARMALSDLHAIAYACGPGSFTGLRIAFSIAQGLAFGAQLPMIPVSSLRALAYRAQQQSQERAQGALVALDARMGELYWAAYQWQELSTAERVPPRLDAIDHARDAMRIWLAQHSDSTWVAAGPGMALVNELETPNLFLLDPHALPDALAVARLAQTQPLSESALAADQAQLSYLRNSVSWNKRQRIRS